MDDSELEKAFEEWEKLEMENIKRHNLRKRAIHLANNINNYLLIENKNQKIENSNRNYCNLSSIIGISLFSLSTIYYIFF